MQASDKFRNRGEKLTNCTIGVGANFLGNCVSILLIEVEERKHFGITLSADEARRLAKSLLSMADTLENPNPSQNLAIRPV